MIDSARNWGSIGSVPAWLEIQGLTEESLRAAVTGLGIEILGALCARAEPALVRVRLCSLVARKFTFTMYAELCRFMELCRARRDSEQSAVPQYGNYIEKMEESAGVLWIKAEDEHSNIEEEERDPEDGRQVDLIRPFPCTFCSQSFTVEAALRGHMTIHQSVSSDRKYKCTQCPYSMHNKWAVRRHIQIHTAARPYTCKVCAKGFITSSYCRIHMRVHTGELPYTCKLCRKSFGYLSSLQRHARTHTGERPYSCTVCDKCFSQSSTLKKHLRIHTGERPYMCTVCRKTFSVSSSFYRHKKVHLDKPTIWNDAYK